MADALVVLSGGQDSTTCLYWAKQRYERVVSLTFDYGQKHRIELESAKKIAKMAAVENEVIELGSIFAGLSPLTNSTTAVEQYADADALPGGLEKTFVPGRNILFLSVAANRGYVLNCTDIIIGVSQEDFGGYPDCRAEFITAMQAALSEGLASTMRIVTPLMHINKKDSVLLAMELSGCMEALSYSTTCYNGNQPPCGHCHSCLLRERGFREAGIEDPLLKRLVKLQAGGS